MTSSTCQEFNFQKKLEDIWRENDYLYYSLISVHILWHCIFASRKVWDYFWKVQAGALLKFRHYVILDVINNYFSQWYKVSFIIPFPYTKFYFQMLFQFLFKTRIDFTVAIFISFFNIRTTRARKLSLNSRTKLSWVLISVILGSQKFDHFLDTATITKNFVKIFKISWISWKISQKFRISISSNLYGNIYMKISFP